MNHILQHRLFEKRPPQGGGSTIEADVKSGHTYHCAARMNWGDGECECGLLIREEARAIIAFQASSDRWALWRADQGHFE